MVDSDRRTFLGVAGGTLAGLSSSSGSVVRLVGSRRQQGGQATKRVVRLSGDPASNAEVRVFDREGTRTKTLEADADGLVEFPFESLGRRVVVISEPVDEEEWFTVRPSIRGAGGLNFESAEELTLDGQLLFGPAYEHVTGAVTAWRWTNPNYPYRGFLLLDVTATQPEDAPVERWEISEGDTQSGTGSGNTETHLIEAPSKATFSVTLPDSVWIGDGDRIGYVMVWEATGAATETIETWHPTRSPTIPPFEVPHVHDEYDLFVKGRQGQNGKKEKREDIREGVNTVASAALDLIPIDVFSDLKSILEVVEWMVGGDEITHWDGDQHASPHAKIDRPNINTSNQVGRVWLGNAADVVYQVPIRLTPSEMDGDEVTLLAEAEWEAVDNSRFGSQLAMGYWNPAVLVRVRGRVLKPDGTPADRSTVMVFKEEDRGYATTATTDENGEFTYRIGSEELHDLHYYQLYDTNTDRRAVEPEGRIAPSDGSPDLFALTQLQPVGNHDLGTIRLPAAHRLDVVVVDESGAPVGNAVVVVEHYHGDADAGWAFVTNQDGRIVWGNGDETGVEVHDEVRIRVSPPDGAARFVDTEHVRDFHVSDPMTTEVTLTEC